MSSTQMPARIFAIFNFGVELWSKDKLPIYDSEQYVRADLAECMAEALEKIVEMNVQHAKDRYGDASEAEGMARVKVARSALAAFKKTSRVRTTRE